MSDTVAIPSPHEGEFERFLMRLHQDRGCAAEMYEDLRRRLIKFFVCNHSCEAEELVDRTLAVLERKIQSEDIRNIFAYALGIARNVQLEASAEFRRVTAVEDMPRGEDSFVDLRGEHAGIVGEIDKQIRLACMRECRTKLPQADDKMVIDYYSAESEKQKVHRERLAKAMGISINVLRVRTNRIRERLEKCVAKCLEDRRKAFAKSYSGSQH